MTHNDVAYQSLHQEIVGLNKCSDEVGNVLGDVVSISNEFFKINRRML